MAMAHRENGSMGATGVPASKLWGAQTQHSLEHFRISTEKMSASLVRMLTLTERAVARASQDLGLLAEDKARAIIQTTDEVLADKHRDGFPPVIR